MGKSVRLFSQYNEVLKMANIVPIAIIGVLLIAMALLVWRRQKGERLGRIGSGQKRCDG